MVGYGKQRLAQCGVAREALYAGDEPEVELVLSSGEIGEQLGLVALGVVHQITRVDFEESRQQQASGVGEMWAGTTLDLRQVGLADRRLARLLAAGVLLLDGTDRLLLGHSAIKAPQVALDFSQIPDFVAQLHITDRNIYIAICNTSQENLSASLRQGDQALQLE